MRTFDLGVIGGGIMGSSAALHAARHGMQVILFDQGPLPNPRGASIDHSKVFRYAYPDPLYVQMAVDAHALWRELEREAGCELLVPTGLLVFGQAEFERACHTALRACDCAAEIISGAEIVRRFPAFDGGAITSALFDPSGAIARAEEAVRVTLDFARRAGVTIVADDSVDVLVADGVVSTRGGHVACAKTLVAAGPWTWRLLPQLAPRLKVTRQEVLYFEPHEPEKFSRERLPVFIELSTGFYGFPVHHGRAMKVANHQKGPRADPDCVDATIHDETTAREFFRRFIPGLADATLVETRVCHYNNTPDDDFIIDWHPQRPDVLIATGFSGHGFKFGPLIGRIAADLLATGGTSTPLNRFALRRFTGM